MRKSNAPDQLWRVLAIAAIGIFLAICTYRFSRHVSRGMELDWGVYYKAGLAIRNGTPLYNLDDGPLLTFRHAPIVAVAYAPLTYLSPAWARFVSMLVDIALLFLMFLIPLKMMEAREFSRGAFWVGVAAFTYCLRYILNQFQAGQTTVIWTSFSIFAFYLAAKLNLGSGDGAHRVETRVTKSGLWRLIVAGILLAAAICVKVVPICFAPYFLIRKKRWPAVGALIVSLVVLLLLPAVVVGWEQNSDLLHQWPAHLKATTEIPFQATRLTNQSIYSLFSRLLTKNEYHTNVANFSLERVQLMWAGFGLMVAAVLYGWMISTWNARSIYSDLTHLSFLLIFMTLFNPQAWRYNFIALIVPVILVIDSIVRFQRGRSVRIALLAIAYVIQSLPAGTARMPWLDWPQIAGARLWAAALIAIAVWLAYREADEFERKDRLVLTEASSSC